MNTDLQKNAPIQFTAGEYAAWAITGNPFDPVPEPLWELTLRVTKAIILFSDRNEAALRRGGFYDDDVNNQDDTV